MNECYYVFINPYFCKVEKEERSYKNYKEVKVKVMNKSVQRKVQLKVVMYEVIIMKLICITLYYELYTVEQVNDYEVFVQSRESS